MSDHAAIEHPHHTEPAAHSAFTDAEIADLHANDLAAARAVVMLMLGIFGTGVFIYSVVAFWVINYSHAS
jgi:hypothetical protein